MTDSKSKRRRKKIRRVKNRSEREANVSRVAREVRVRNPFQGKVRRGDEAQLDLSFVATTVPFDPAESDVAEAVRRRHEAVQAWTEAGAPTVGEA